MGRIIELDINIQNLISAGEVIEKCANVCKELIENSIDANAKMIKVELKDCGLSEIKVTDNGDGMDDEDALLAFKRHATSKIRNEYDLFRISTLGFRGEAIPSIAAISELHLETGTGNSGFEVLAKGGKIIKANKYQAQKGTIMTVNNIFYNTPARLKYLKNLNVELSAITDIVTKFAISNPQIKFVLTNNGKEIINTPGNNNLLEALAVIYDYSIIKKAHSFNTENRDFKISGFIFEPVVNRPNKGYITIICNGRVVHNQAIIQAVVNAYYGYIPKGRYPITVLKINVDPLLIDVNIHPTKFEIKFSEEESLKKLIIETIQNKLKGFNLIVDVKYTDEINNVEKQEQLVLPKENILEEIKEDYKNNEIKQSKVFEQVKTNEPIEIVKPFESYEITKEIKEDKIDNISEDIITYESEKVKEQVIFKEPIKTIESVKETSERKIPKLSYIGQYEATYLLAQNEEGLFIIDQHAAAERIRYERYKKIMQEKEIRTYDLLIPLEYSITQSEMIQVEPYLADIEKLGVTLVKKESNLLLATKIPTFFPVGMEIPYIDEIIDMVINNQEKDILHEVDKVAMQLSCKHSIKANKYLSLNEIYKLLDDLEFCENPYNCPHGRPVIIKITKYEMEKMFKRVI